MISKDPFGGVSSELDSNSPSPFKIDKEEALKQISGYLSALKKREDMSLALLKGCLIAERIPKNIVSSAGQLGFTSYEIMYPIKLTKV